MMVKVGNRELEMDGEQLTELRSSNDIMQDMQALRERMEEDGYLLIRGFHDRGKVLDARTSILEKWLKWASLIATRSWKKALWPMAAKPFSWGNE